MTINLLCLLLGCRNRFSFDTYHPGEDKPRHRLFVCQRCGVHNWKTFDWFLAELWACERTEMGERIDPSDTQRKELQRKINRRCRFQKPEKWDWDLVERLLGLEARQP